jgi:hypothetical protein
MSVLSCVECVEPELRLMACRLEGGLAALQFGQVFARHTGAAKLDDLAVLDGFDPPSLFFHRISANRQEKKHDRQGKKHDRQEKKHDRHRVLISQPYAF